MNSSFLINNVVRFFLLLVVQILVLKNIQVSTYIDIFIYPMFILLLPIRTPHWLCLVMAFLMGFIIDGFYDTLGLHAATATLTAYVREYVLRLLEPRGGFSSDRTPNRLLLGSGWFLRYAAILMLIHLTFCLFFETLSFAHFHILILRIAMSYVFSLILVVLPQYLFQLER